MDKIKIILGASILLCSSVGNASIITFESLRVDSDQQTFIHGTSYTEDGFSLSVTCCEPVAGSQETDLRTGGTLAPEFAGSTAMRGGKSNTLITLTADDSSIFNLLSIDLAVFPGTVLVDGKLVPVDTVEPLVVTFNGLKTSGDTITQAFLHTDFLDLTTYFFQGFSQLQSVFWFVSEGVGQNPEPAHQFDNIRAVRVPAPITIDIKPGSDPNSINLKSKGVIPVAILSTNIAEGDAQEFDATQVDALTVEFGPNGAVESHGQGHVEDVDGDGDSDMVFHFKTQETGIVCGDADATLVGETFGGIPFTGTDTVRTVGCNSSKQDTSISTKGAGTMSWIFLVGLSVLGLWRRDR